MNKNIITIGGSEFYVDEKSGIKFIDAIVKANKIAKKDLIVYGYSIGEKGAFTVAQKWADKNKVTFKNGNPQPKNHNGDWQAALTSRNTVLTEESKLLINFQTKNGKVSNGGSSFVTAFQSSGKKVEIVKDFEEVDTSKLTPIQRRKGEVPNEKDVLYSVSVYSEIARKLLAVGAIMLDTESTGISNTDEVVDIAIADCNSKVVLFNSYIKTDVQMNPAASKANGVTQEMLEERSKGAPTLDEVWETIEKLVGNKIVVSSHSNSGVAWFDERIINQSLLKHGKRCSFLWYDLQPLYRMYSCQLNESQYPLRTDGICLQLGLEAGTHAAKEDVLAQISILHAMAKGTIPNFDV